MKFVDEVEIEIAAGDGGNGCIAFRREKYEPHGGPSGGDGGRGGSIILLADVGLSTLLDLRYRPRLRAGRGEHGRGKDQHGRGAEDLTTLVPVGTVAFDVATGEMLGDLDKAGAKLVVARGGRGGLGNINYANSIRQAPRIAQPGGVGDQRRLRLELRLLADVGLVGRPNAGKSSLVARLSAARPRVADYPFTTLVPQLGVVRIDIGASFVLADVPGLVEGAHLGVGLGTRFLKHLSRTSVLVHLIDLAPLDERDILEDFAGIEAELRKAAGDLADKPRLVVGNKLDMSGAADNLETLRAALAPRGFDVLGVSAMTGEGAPELANAMFRLVQQDRERAAAEAKDRAVEEAGDLPDDPETLE